MASPTQTFQLSVEAAEAYEARFVPALFAEWAPHLVGAAGVAPGQAVLDVACGTGVVARAAADRMGGHGRVAGADLNEGMLAVAGRLRPDIEWHRADAADLPFADGSFDAVLCQSALMFFPDQVRALRERPGWPPPAGRWPSRRGTCSRPSRATGPCTRRSPGTWARRPPSWAAPCGPSATWSGWGRCSRRPGSRSPAPGPG
jgi:SAM-dependent methyltransferase